MWQPDLTEALPAEEIDHKATLDAPALVRCAKWREVRKAFANKASLPPYTVFTNGQMAEVARRRCTTSVDMGKVDGIGTARVENYGAACLEPMKSGVPLVASDEGWASWCDALPAHCSQGATREEARVNIREAITETFRRGRRRFPATPECVRCSTKRFRLGHAQASGHRTKDTVRLLEKRALRVVRPGKSIEISNGAFLIQRPRHTVINAYAMGFIVQVAGLTPEQFRALLQLRVAV